MRARWISAACLASAGLLFVIGLWLLFDNPTVDVSAADVDSTAPAGRVGCVIAPYDAGLLRNDDPPGGEHPRAFNEEVASECYAVNRKRFTAGVVSGVLGLALVVAAAVVSARGRAVHS